MGRPQFKRPAIPFSSSCRFRKRGLRPEDELGIAELPHLRNVETVQLGLRRHPMSDDVFEHHVDGKAQREYDTEQRGDAYQLRGELPGISVEQTGHGTWNAVPATTIVAGPVGEEAHCQDAP